MSNSDEWVEAKATQSGDDTSGVDRGGVEKIISSGGDTAVGSLVIVDE